MFHVIGGAGGKLNYLKLRGVKSAGQYAKEVAAKQGEKRKAKQEQTKRDKELGTHEAKQAARAQVDQARRSAEKAFVRTVADKLGWKPEELAPAPEKLEGLSDRARAKVVQAHHAEVMRTATEAVEKAHAQLLASADERLAETLTEPDVQDLSREGLGYNTDYAGRTADVAEDIKAEARAVDAPRSTPEKVAATSKAKETAAAVRDEIAKADIPKAAVRATLAKAADAVELLKASQALKSARKQAAKAKADIDSGKERKAFVVEVGSAEDLDQAARDKVEQDLRTLKTRGFLSEVGKLGNDDTLGRHLGIGAYNALNGVALTIAAKPLIDRDAVDVLGTAGAAQALAHRLRTDLSPEQFQAATEALEAYHADHYIQRGEEALREAAELREQLKEMAIPPAGDGHDLNAAMAINEAKRDAVAKMRGSLGQALGEFEANAALLLAMKGSPNQAAKVALGQLKTEDAIRRLRAIGLGPGDYGLEHAGAEVIATVRPDGLSRITQPADPEHAAAIRDAMDIQEGKHDEEDFWPSGVARRPDMGLSEQHPAGVARNFAEPFQPGEDLHTAIRDHIGSRMADGHAIGDIVGDLQSGDYARMTGERHPEYAAALKDVVPLRGEDGKVIEHESRREAFQGHADAFMQKRYGQAAHPLHSQPLEADATSAEALHRAFAEEPAGPLGFKAVGELTPQDQGALRDYFDTHIGSKDAKTSKIRGDIDAHLGREPEKEVDDMFGRGTNPEHVAWSQQRDALQEKLRSSGLDWSKYSSIMGGPENAYAAVQDHLRGRVVSRFTDTHNRLRPDSPLKLGRTSLRNHISHLDAVDPAAREKRLAEQAEITDSLRARNAGRYAAGSVHEKMDAAREAQAALDQAQMGFFATQPEAAAPRELGADERHTIGATAENQLAKLSERVGQNFKPGEPVKLSPPSLTGKYINQQRAIKLAERVKRLILNQGVGSGKTGMGLNSFAHLHTKGQTKRGLFAVPSIVQGQFGNEALNMLEPGRFKWHAEPGASRAERLAAYKDPNTHFSVVTHQALRDDMLHMGAKQAGIDEAAMTEAVNKMTPQERKAWAAGVMKNHGMDHSFMMVDEGHDLLNRAGKENSTMANVLDGVSDNMTHYLNASGDAAAKNDVSETFDVLSKMDRERYNDRDAFMRRYGVDAIASKDQLRREMSKHLYAGRIDPGVRVHTTEHKVELSDAQKADMAKVDEAAGKLRVSRLEGKADIDAARTMSPDSFEGVPEDQHQGVAERLAQSAGILHETAAHRVLSAHPENAKTEALAKIANDRKGKPGVVFARSLDAVKQIADRLKADGHRVVTITGGDSAKEKQAKRLQFRPESGEASADVLVASDAGAVGLNAQRGSWLAQYDTPVTAKAQPLDAKILTPTGWRLMGEIQVGDEVIAGDGTPTRVLGVYPQGEKDIFAVTFGDGGSTECCAEHLWSVASRNDRRRGSGFKVRPLAQIMRNFIAKEGPGRYRPNYVIPLAPAAEFTARDVSINPYLMGLLLGDGEFGERHVSLTTADREVVEAAREACAAINAEVHEVGAYAFRLVGDGRIENCYPMRRPSPVLFAIRGMGLARHKSWEKFVPPAYLWNTAAVRLAVLQGLLDTDGTVDKRNGSVSFCSTSERLTADVTFLARSLGGIASAQQMRSERYEHQGEQRTGRPSMRTTIILPAGLEPFRLSRKAEFIAKRREQVPTTRTITGIAHVGKKPAQCIMVEHPSHLYVTDDFIVTHNTHAQRNGRIHRLGQKNPDIELHDLVANHPREHEARRRLKTKYRLRDALTSPLPGLDDHGFASYLRKHSA